MFNREVQSQIEKMKKALESQGKLLDKALDLNEALIAQLQESHDVLDEVIEGSRRYKGRSSKLRKKVKREECDASLSSDSFASDNSKEPIDRISSFLDSQKLS